MADYKIGDLIQHKCGDIGVVVKIDMSTISDVKRKKRKKRTLRVWVFWLDSDGLDEEPWHHFPDELDKNTTKL